MIRLRSGTGGIFAGGPAGSGDLAGDGSYFNGRFGLYDWLPQLLVQRVCPPLVDTWQEQSSVQEVVDT